MMTKQAAEKVVEPNCKNRTVFIGDNREVMNRLNSGIADAIITDPPFNSEQTLEDAEAKSIAKKPYPIDEHGNPTRGFDDKWSITDLKRAEIEFLQYKDADLLSFCEIVGRTHSAGMEAYLMMMASRLLLCHELLKETGSIFLHCNESSNNYLRTLMDMIFGRQNFRNEIIWCYTGPSAARKQFPRKHETIFWYSKSNRWTFNADAVRVPYSEDYVKRFAKEYNEGKDKSKIFSGGHDTVRNQELAKQGKTPESWWTKFSPVGRLAKERCGKPTQKTVALYSRLILASTNPGDLVIDPFCGCATTLVAAENAGRQWIGIDINPTSKDLVLEQLDKLNENSLDFWRKNIHFPKKPKPRTDNKLSSKELRQLKEKKMVEQLEHRPYLICAICDHPKDTYDLEVDHIHPKSNRGGNELKNLQLLCSRCNRRKGGTKTNEQVRAELRAEGLLYEQRVKIHNYMKSLTPSQKDHIKGLKQRKKPRWKEDLEREKASRQTKMGL